MSGLRQKSEICGPPLVTGGERASDWAQHFEIVFYVEQDRDFCFVKGFKTMAAIESRIDAATSTNNAFENTHEGPWGLFSIHTDLNREEVQLVDISKWTKWLDAGTSYFDSWWVPASHVIGEGSENFQNDAVRQESRAWELLSLGFVIFRNAQHCGRSIELLSIKSIGRVRGTSTILWTCESAAKLSSWCVRLEGGVHYETCSSEE